MEDNTLPPAARLPLPVRLAALDSNRLVGIMRYKSPVWESLISTLRPMDIVSLAIATKFRVQPAEGQMQIYMQWWRQTFYDMRWVEQNEGKVTVIGKDLVRLMRAIQRWDYFDTSEMKLLVMVQEDWPARERDEARRALIASINTSYMWGINAYRVPASRVQTCVIFLENQFLRYADLCFSWSRSLLEPIEARAPLNMHGTPLYPNADGTFSPLPQIDLPIGTMEGPEEAEYSPRDQWFRAWYIKARLPNFWTDQCVTRPGVHVDPQLPTEFHRTSVVRLLIKEDGSVLVPAIPAAARRLWSDGVHGLLDLPGYHLRYGSGSYHPDFAGS